MRQLHPVGWHEKFVASGVYKTVEDRYAHSPNFVEEWSIHELPDTSQIIRVDRSDTWVTSDGIKTGESQLIEAYRGTGQDGGRIERFDTHFYGAANHSIKLLKVSYTFEKQHLIIRKDVDGIFETIEVELPSDYIVAGGSLLFGGFVARELQLRRGDCVSVIACSVGSLVYFQGEVYSIREEKVVSAGREQREFSISGQTVFGTFCRIDSCEYYQDGEIVENFTRFWIDEKSILLEYRTGGPDTYRLTQYVRRPEPPQS